MRWNNNKKQQHPKWEQENGENQVKSSWKSVMNSVHNKLSRGAEYISRVMTSPQKDQWRKGHGRSPEKKHDGHHNHDHHIHKKK